MFDVYKLTHMECRGVEIASHEGHFLIIKPNEFEYTSKCLAVPFIIL